MDSREILETLAEQAPPVRAGWPEHVFHLARRSRRRRKVASLSAAAGAALGIGAVSVTLLAGPAPHRGGTAPGPMARAQDPAAGPYAASIAALARQTRRGQAGQWPVIYILDHTCSNAAERPVTAATCDAEPLSATLRHDLAKTLSTYGRSQFIADPAAVIGPGPCPTVIHGGIVIILGPVTLHATHARVPISDQIDCLNGQGFIYRLAERHGHWTIAGITGPSWIS
jgi:hypothetical protein